MVKLLNNRSIKALVLACLSFSFIWHSSAEKLHKNGTLFSGKNARVNIDFEFGKSLVQNDVFLLKEVNSNVNTQFDRDSFKVIFSQTNFNYGITISGGYNFPIAGNKKLGFEVGIGYGFPKLLRLPGTGITFKENHLKVPILMTVLETYQKSFYFAQSLLLGYEFEIILSSKYEQSGDFPTLHASLKGNKDIQKYITDFSRLSGRFLLGTRFDFPKGIYIRINAVFPIETFKIIFGQFDKKEDQLNSYFINRIRQASTSLLTLNIGVNIIDWLYPKRWQSESN